MAQKVVSDLKELKNLSSEIKRLNTETKILRLKKKEIEDNIMEYLHEVDQPGVKYGDLVVLSKERNTRKRLKKKEKEENAILTLENMGVINAKEALQSILESMKGEEIVVESLQIKETKLQSL
jgi:hypothetical protein